MTIDRDAVEPGAEVPAGPAAAAPPVAADAAPAGARRRRFRRPSVPVVALLLALLLSLGATGWSWQESREDDKLEDARRAVTTVAQTYAINLTTYDHATLDRDFARVLDNSTGSFKNQYTLASQTLRGLIAKFKAVATGKVLEIAVTSVDSRRAEVLLFVDQTVTNANAKDPRIDRSRMKMGLEKQDGRWLINSLDLI